MCFFLYVNAPLFSMLTSSYVSVWWYFIILVLIAGIVGIVFCLLLGLSVLLMHPLYMLCNFTLSVNDPFCQCSLLLIYCYIDIWDCWGCVLSVIAPVRPYMLPPPSCWYVFTSCLTLLSVHPPCFLLICLTFYKCSLLSVILSINVKQYW